MILEPCAFSFEHSLWALPEGDESPRQIAASAWNYWTGLAPSAQSLVDRRMESAFYQYFSKVRLTAAQIVSRLFNVFLESLEQRP
jgi:hypothetical protein